MKNEDHAETGNQTEQAYSVPATQECEAGRVLEWVRNNNSECPVCGGVEGGHCNDECIFRLALTAPCPCTQLRQERDSRLSPEAERELRAELATAQAEAERQRKAHDGLLVEAARLTEEVEKLRQSRDLPQSGFRHDCRDPFWAFKIDANLKMEAALRERTALTPSEER